MFARVLAVVLCFSVPLIGHAKTIKIVMPKGAPEITSHFQSMKGVNGLRRSARHQGIDIPAPNRQPIIAIARGTVLGIEVDTCWGPTLLVDHGKGVDGKRLFVLYGHMGDIVVKKGQTVRRGQLVGRLGDNHKKFKCIARVRHLHLQIGRKLRTRSRGNAWGHLRYLDDGNRGVNPHQYWANGAGQVTCFRAGQSYPSGTITYPLPCK
ncbi:MAG: M23 family metallopeptidase [Amylibacter sp.]|nr:M23 family metallopeptidase [Amylibacter sp.]